MIIKIIFSFALISLSSCLTKRNHFSKGYTGSLENESGIYIIDTLYLKKPILLTFKNEYGDWQSVVLEKKKLENLKEDQVYSYPIFFLSEGYRYMNVSRFYSLLNIYSENFDTSTKDKFSILIDSLRETVSDKIIGTEFNQGKYKNTEFNYLKPRKYLFCLIKGKILDNPPTIHHISISGMDNVYFKVLVPLTRI